MIVESETDAPVINVTAAASTPEGAQKLADAWANAIAVRIQQVNLETEVGSGVGLTVVQFAIFQGFTKPLWLTKGED